MGEDMYFQKIEDVARDLGMSTAVIRKYQLEIEASHGYRFRRNNQGRLLFSNFDVDMFHKIVFLKNEQKKSVSEAIAEAVKDVKSIKEQNYNDYETHNEASSTQVKQEGELQVELNSSKEVFEMLVQLKELLVEQKASMDKKDQQIALLLEERNNERKLLEEKLNQRDENLMTLMRDMQDVKKQMASASEPKGFFAKLFGK